MPKVTVLLTEEQMLEVMNRNLRIPGDTISVVSRTIVLDEDYHNLTLSYRWSVLVDICPIVDQNTHIFFLQFMRKVYGPTYDISRVEDPEDYAVLENLLAAASHQSPFSFNYAGE